MLCGVQLVIRSVYVMPIRANVGSSKCLFEQMFIPKNVHLDKCLSGKCPFLMYVQFSGKI